MRQPHSMLPLTEPHVRHLVRIPDQWLEPSPRGRAAMARGLGPLLRKLQPSQWHERHVVPICLCDSVVRSHSLRAVLCPLLHFTKLAEVRQALAAACSSPARMHVMLITVNANINLAHTPFAGLHHVALATDDFLRQAHGAQDDGNTHVRRWRVGGGDGGSGGALGTWPTLSGLSGCDGTQPQQYGLVVC